MNAAPTTHWTGKPHRLDSTISIDGQEYFLLGEAPTGKALPQKELRITPAQTKARFEGQGLSVELTFLTPALPDDLDLLTWPVTYLIWHIRSLVGQEHHVDLQVSAQGEIATNTQDQKVQAEVVANPADLMNFRIGSVEQAILAKAGDDLRIDWGYLYLVSDHPLAKPSVCVADQSKQAAATQIQLLFPCGTVGAAGQEVRAVLAYDDVYSIQYMRPNLAPYWKLAGRTMLDLLDECAKRWPEIRERCDRFDQGLCRNLERAGGSAYARLGALA